MAEGGEDGVRAEAGGGEEEEEQEQEPQWREYLNAEESRELDNSLFFEYEFSIDQLMEIAGLCVAQVRRENGGVGWGGGGDERRVCVQVSVWHVLSCQKWRGREK